MQHMSQYEGGFLNHMEGIYRSEDRDLAVELVKALGLAHADIQFTANSKPILAIHPNADDKDPTNNIIFLFEMPEGQRKVLDLMEKQIAANPELGDAVREYRETAQKMPAIMPHFGLRYRSVAQLQAVIERVENSLSPALKARVELFEMPAYEPIDGLPDIRQVFVRTDVFSVGTAGMEQAIELQVVRDKA